MAKFGLKEGGSTIEVFEADTVVVRPPHATAIFYSGSDEWRETARIRFETRSNYRNRSIEITAVTQPA